MEKNVLNLSIPDLVTLVTRGEVSAEEVTRLSLGRIERLLDDEMIRPLYAHSRLLRDGGCGHGNGSPRYSRGRRSWRWLNATLPSALLLVNTRMVDRVLDDPLRAGRLTAHDRRGLAPLFLCQRRDARHVRAGPHEQVPGLRPRRDAEQTVAVAASPLSPRRRAAVTAASGPCPGCSHSGIDVGSSPRRARGPGPVGSRVVASWRSIERPAGVSVGDAGGPARKLREAFTPTVAGIRRWWWPAR